MVKADCLGVAAEQPAWTGPTTALLCKHTVVAARCLNQQRAMVCLVDKETQSSLWWPKLRGAHRSLLRNRHRSDVAYRIIIPAFASGMAAAARGPYGEAISPFGRTSRSSQLFNTAGSSVRSPYSSAQYSKYSTISPHYLITMPELALPETHVFQQRSHAHKLANSETSVFQRRSGHCFSVLSLMTSVSDLRHSG